MNTILGAAIAITGVGLAIINWLTWRRQKTILLNLLEMKVAHDDDIKNLAIRHNALVGDIARLVERVEGPPTEGTVRGRELLAADTWILERYTDGKWRPMWKMWTAGPTT